MRKPRFVAIITPGEEKPFAVFDRITKQSYAGTRERGVAEWLASEFSRKYSVPWYRRILALLIPLPLPGPDPDPVEEPEWKKRYARINAVCEARKERNRLADGGRIVETDSIN